MLVDRGLSWDALNAATALAEALEAPVATLDGGLASAAGPRCQFVMFEG